MNLKGYERTKKWELCGGLNLHTITTGWEARTHLLEASVTLSGALGDRCLYGAEALPEMGQGLAVFSLHGSCGLFRRRQLGGQSVDQSTDQ